MRVSRFTHIATVVLVLVVANACIQQLYAQAPLEEENLLTEISNPQSENHYSSLMLRFEGGDTTLTLDNYRHLYYGYAYQSSYKPLEVNPYMDKLLLLASELDVEKPNVDILKQIIFVAKDALKSDPFSIKVWNLMAYAYGALGDSMREVMAFNRVQMIMATIKSTGSGLKENSAQHVLMFDHALDVMAADNLQHKKPMIVSRTVEYIPLVAPRTVDDIKVKGFYFDFGRVYWNKPDDVTYTRDRTWQFNNLAPKEYK